MKVYRDPGITYWKYTNPGGGWNPGQGGGVPQEIRDTIPFSDGPMIPSPFFSESIDTL